LSQMSQLSPYHPTRNPFANQSDQVFTFEEKTTRTRHTILGGIKKVCTTDGGIFILSWSGRVYGFGALGAVELTHFSTHSQTESTFFPFDSGEFEDKFFTDIVSGSDILYLFSTNNELFAIGANSYALTGQISPVLMTSLTRIATFLDEDEYPVLATICFSSSLIYTSKNRVFVMGQTSWFIDGASDYYALLSYNSNKRIVSMSGAHFHANMLDEDGQVYVCGEQSDYNKLGIDEKVRDLVPLSTIQEKVVIAHCAFNHSIFVTQSQKVLLCGRDIPGKLYNNVPFLIELDMIARLPMTFVTHVSSSESRAIVHTNNGVFSNESIFYHLDHYEIGFMTSELKRIPNSLFEKGFTHFGRDMIQSTRSSCGSYRVAFYTASGVSSVANTARAFPRLFDYTTKRVLIDVDIITTQNE